MTTYVIPKVKICEGFIFVYIRQFFIIETGISLLFNVYTQTEIYKSTYQIMPKNNAQFYEVIVTMFT